MALSGQLKRLGKHSVDLRPRRPRLADPRRPAAAALHALPLARPTTARSRRSIALVTVLTIVLQFGISSRVLPLLLRLADDADRRRLVLRTSFWFTMTMATLGLVVLLASRPRSRSWLFGDADAANLVRASVVALWAQMNYEQLTNLFRVEERVGRVRPREPRRTSSSRSGPRCCSSSCSTRDRSGSIVGNFIGHAHRLPRRSSATGASSSGSS